MNKIVPAAPAFTPRQLRDYYIMHYQVHAAALLFDPHASRVQVASEYGAAWRTIDRPFVEGIESQLGLKHGDDLKERRRTLCQQIAANEHPEDLCTAIQRYVCNLIGTQYTEEKFQEKAD